MNVMTMKRDAIVVSIEAGSAEAFFSVKDIHAYYGESYIVQGVTLDVYKGRSSRCLAATVRARPRR
jgi:branched-chain amino acid transport system ATP-binding protein